MRTGSFMNDMYDSSINMPVPEVGMGATVLLWTDRYAATIVEVRKTGGVVKEVDIIYDFVEPVHRGLTDVQTWTYTPVPGGRVRTFTYRKNGKFIEKGDTTKTGLGLVIGVRDHYHDYNF